MNELVMCIVTQNIVPNTVELDWPSVTSFWGLTVATGRQNKTWQHAESGYQTAGFGTVVRCHFAARRVLKRVFENENKNDNEKKTKFVGRYANPSFARILMQRDGLRLALTWVQDVLVRDDNRICSLKVAWYC